MLELGEKQKRNGSNLKKMVKKQAKRKVLLVGWDAADWKIIDKLMDAGLMPAMKRVVDNGVRGRLATLDPPLSPMLWTSMATGVRPYTHGVLGFVEHDGVGGIRSVSSHSRKVNAFWNMLTKEGLKSNIIGWWPSNPVESINGCMVSNLFQQERKSGKVIDLEDWAMPAGTIYPESMIERLSDLRIHPSEITGNIIMPFVPKAVELNKKEDKRLNILTRFIAHATSLHAVTTDLMEDSDWDLTAVYHDAIDHFSHAFMKYHPPKMDGLDEEAYDLFKDVVKGAYVFHDMMLERMLNLIDEHTTVIIVSDHGFHSDHLRPRFVPQVPSGPAVEHAPYGIFVAMGPGIKKGERIHGASILDLTPTLLNLFDLPVGMDMDGKVLSSIYSKTKEVKYIDSWENDNRFGGELVVSSTPDEATNEAALQQLIDLGYINDLQIPEGEDEEEVKRKQLKENVRENNFYLAKAYVNGGKYEEALELLLEIENRDKPDYRFLIEIVKTATRTGRFKLGEEYIQYIRKNKLMADKYLDVLEAQVSIGLRNPEKAMKLLESAVDEFPEAPNVLFELGKLLNTVGQYGKAKKVFDKMLKLDPENHYAYHGAGLACLRMELYDEALDYLLKSVDGFFHYPNAHMHIGETLALMKEYEMAKRSFEIVEAIAPEMIKAQRWLYDLHELTGNIEAAAHYSNKISRFEKGRKNIVTGLPGKKLADSISDLKSRGYVVNESKDDLFREDLHPSDKKWLDVLEGDVLYIPLRLIPSLPQFYAYRILFVKETTEEVADYLNSLARMRKQTYNQGMIAGLSEIDAIARIWFDQQPGLDIYYTTALAEVEDSVLSTWLANTQK